MWLAAVLGSTAGSACDKPVEFGTIEWPPYFMWTADGKPYGLDAEFIDAVFTELGCPYSLTTIPYKRALRAVQDGKLQGVPAVSFLPERAKYAYFSAPIRNEVIALFMRQNDINSHQVDTVQDLVSSDLRVGIVLGGWLGPEFTLARENNPGFQKRVTESDSFRKLFQLLKNGAVDVVVTDLLSGLDIIEADHMTDIGLRPTVVHKNPVYLMLGKARTDPETVAAINRAIQKVQATPTYTKLIEKYVPFEMKAAFILVQ